MIHDPTLLIPTFRSGRETPWSGDVLRQEYGKYTLGNMIGESYDFCILPDRESTLPNGVKLSSYLNTLGCEPPLPFLIKWTDAEKATSVHVHTYDEYLYVVRVQKDHSRIIYLSDDFQQENAESVLSGEADGAFSSMTVSQGDVISIPAGTAHALNGFTCYQIQPHKHEAFRLYDWNRTNSRGQKRSLQITHALTHLTEIKPQRIAPSDDTLINKRNFKLLHITPVHHHPLTFDGRFAVLTCLQDAVLSLASGRLMYLSKGQSVFIPQSSLPNILTGEDCLLAVAKE